ncbi:MAG: MMPL family transporter [Planctomycetes bacterium]|nr:MMPL family transporter [Planctomycetota bacterium]
MLAECLCWLTDLCSRHARLTTWLVILSAIGCIAYTVQCIKFKTDRADLIDPAASFQKRWKRYTESFGDTSDMVVVVESKTPETIKQVLDELGGRLQNDPKLFTNVLYKVEPGKLRDKGLQYLSPDQLISGLERLDEYRPILAGKWELIRLEGLVPRIKNQMKRLEKEGRLEDSVLMSHADRLAASLVATMNDRNDFTNPWPDILPVDPQMQDQANQTVYLLNDDGTMGFVMASPVDMNSSFEGATAAIDKLRHMIGVVAHQYPDVKIALTGIPVLENDEMRRSQADSLMASVISYLGVALILFVGFRGFLHPMLGLLMLAIGMAWSFGYTTLAVGHLNILSVSFVAILIGLGIDFAVHILSKYLELRHQGLGLRAALVETTGSVGGGIATGAVTTSLAFFCATFTEFLGVAELGIIAGGGILLCALAAFTFLPAIVTLADRHKEPRKLPTPFKAQALRHLTLHHPWLVLFVSLGFIAYVGARSFDWSGPMPKPVVVYDHNLLHLQAKGLESVEAQRHIFESSKHSLLYAISVADSAEQARDMKQRLEALPTVHHVQELASRLPAYPATETKLLVQAFNAQLAKLPDAPPEPAPLNPGDVGKALEELYNAMKVRRDPVSQRIAANLDQFLDGIQQMSLQEQMSFLTEFQYRMSYALLAQFQAIAAASDPEPVEPSDLPPELKARFVSPQGQWLLQVYPRDQVWDMGPLERFVNEVRTVDPEVTGVPLQNYEAAQQIKHSYEICALYALAVIMVTLLLDFSRKERLLWTFVPALAATFIVGLALQTRQADWSPGLLLMVFAGLSFAMGMLLDRRAVGHSILAMVPPGIGMGITFGLLVILGIPLNPANLIILPLILGIGVDNGVHIVHDCRAQSHRIYCTAPSTINAIMLTSLTTMVGFGSMMTAAHRGLYSLGAVLTIGVGACLFVSLVTLPAILTILTRYRLQMPDMDTSANPGPAAQSSDSADAAETQDEMLTDDDEPPATIKMRPGRVA